MKLRTKAFLACVVVCVVIVAFVLQVRSENRRQAIWQASADAKQLAMFLRDYSSDHAGRLPNSMNALIDDPQNKYLNSDEFMGYEAKNNCELLFPGKEWNSIPPTSAVLRLSFGDARSVIAVYPDLHTDVVNR